MSQQPKRYKSKLSSVTTKMVAPVASVTINATAEGAEPNSPKTFNAAPAYSGGVVSRFTATPSMKHDYVIDLSGMTMAKGAKVNLDHKAAQRVGHITGFHNDGKTLAVDGALSAATPHRDEVANNAANQYPWDVSIEGDLQKPTLIAAGKTAVVNGHTVTGPVYVFKKSTLTGLAFVSQGADEGNSVAIAASKPGASNMTDFEKFAASLGVDLDAITDEHRANLEAVHEAKAGKPAKRSSLAEMAAAEERENKRVDSITKIAQQYMRQNPHAIAAITLAAERAVEEGHDDDKFELTMIRECRVTAGKFRNQQSGRVSDAVTTAAICLAAGLPNVEKEFSADVLQAVDDNGMRGFSLQQYLIQTAHQNGYTSRPGERVTTGNLRTILEYCFPPASARAQLGFSTASLPNILGAVANKQILAGYKESDNTWQEIAEIKPVSNFYTQNHYRMLDSLEYEEVGSGGEIKHGSLGEETYTSQAKTYGKMLGLTRNQIINDDLGAFADIRTRLGAGAAKKFSNVFWTAFINNSSFFTSGLTNYISGSTTNLGTDGVGLGLCVAAFRQMTTPSADGLKRVGADLNPTKILVPPELETNALLAYKNANLGMVASSAANIFQNRFRPVVQWRLSNSSYTGYSTTAFYMFGDEAKPMLVTFLNGQQSPTVESTDADFDTLGILFRGYHDFGCDKSEYMAGIKSKGAS